MVTPNALASSVSVVDLATEKSTEIPTGGVIPIAAWADMNHKAYVANLLGTPLLSTMIVELHAPKRLRAGTKTRTLVNACRQ